VPTPGQGDASKLHGNHPSHVSGSCTTEVEGPAPAATGIKGPAPAASAWHKGLQGRLVKLGRLEGARI
jgi:hypothetical protein